MTRDDTSHFIPLCVPEIRGHEWAYIKECLDTNWVSSVGVFVERFEQAVADAVGRRFGVAMASGTAALHIALLVAGIEANDEVLVPALTFIAPANAVRYVGAWPVFIDADPIYWQMDAEKVADFLTTGCQWQNGRLYNRITKRPVKAIMPVHVLGHPVDMTPILALARKYDLVVIEDATESLGSRYQEMPAGSLGDIACFSFNGNKIITTGGGGMLVTDNEIRAQRAKYLSTQAKDNAVEYVHQAIGYNYRLNNVQAAMGVAQLEQLPAYMAAKRRIADRYETALQEIKGITFMAEAAWALSNRWLSTILLDESVSGYSARDLLLQLSSRNIQTRPLWQPLHQSPAHKGAFALPCPIAERLHTQSLCLPSSVGLTESEQSRVIASIAQVGSSTSTSH